MDENYVAQSLFVQDSLTLHTLPLTTTSFPFQQRMDIFHGGRWVGGWPEKGRQQYGIELKIFLREWPSGEAEVEGEQLDICLFVGNISLTQEE